MSIDSSGGQRLYFGKLKSVKKKVLMKKIQALLAAVFCGAIFSVAINASADTGSATVVRVEGRSAIRWAMINGRRWSPGKFSPSARSFALTTTVWPIWCWARTLICRGTPRKPNGSRLILPRRLTRVCAA